jgi:protein-tyrosine phosphatase
MDDGAETLEDSVAMVRMAAQAGTTDIVATPHANLTYRFDPALISERITALQAAVGPQPHIHRGCDFHLSYDNIQDAIANPAKYSINGGGYLLVEFSDLAIFHTATHVFERLLAAGLKPIITHPERNGLLQQRLQQIEQWVAMGCLLQVTAASILGGFGSRARHFSEVLLKHRLVHFVASDAHDCQYRPPVLDKARQHLHKRFGAAVAEQLTTTNPLCAVTNAPLPEAAPVSSRSWYQALFGRQ